MSSGGPLSCGFFSSENVFPGHGEYISNCGVGNIMIALNRARHPLITTNVCFCQLNKA